MGASWVSSVYNNSRYITRIKTNIRNQNEINVRIYQRGDQKS